MTKIPVILSILSLVGANSFLPANTNLMAERVALEQKSSASVVANQNVAGLNFTELNLAMGQLNWEFQYHDNEGRTFSRYVIASLNFLDGVTEAEADQNLATLGEADWDTWTNWRVDYDARDDRYGEGAKLSANIAWGDPLQFNQSDLIYYAVQYKNWNDPSVAPVWYRGKLDYRSCAHDPNLETTYQKTCKIALDSSTNQYVITPSGGKLSYADEMAQIARNSYLTPVEEQIAQLERRKQDGDESYRNSIGGVEYELDEAKRLIDAMHMSEQLSGEITDLEQRLAELKKQDSDSDSDSGNDNSAVEKPDDDQGNKGDDNLISGETIGNIGAEVGGGVGVTANSQAVAESETVGQLTMRRNMGDTTSDAELIASDGQGKVDYGGDEVGVGQANNKSAIGVPKLGASEPWLKRHLWVLLLPVGLIGLVIIVLVRRRRDDNDEI